MKIWAKVILLNTFIICLTFCPGAKAQLNRSIWQNLFGANDAAMSTAEEQLDYANDLMNSGEIHKAAKHHKSLIHTWPNSKHAPAAQLHYANYLRKNGELRKAFEQYQILVDNYTGFFPYSEVFNAQYDIAEKLANTRSKNLLFKNRISEKNLKLYRQLINSAPNFKKAAELRLKLADMFKAQGNYETAIKFYRSYITHYPNGEEKEKAYFAIGSCFYQLSEKIPRSKSLAESALNAFEYFTALYPFSDLAAQARQYISRLKAKQVDLYYKQAKFYFQKAFHAHKAKERVKILNAAKIMFKRIVEEYPESIWLDTAKSRIQQINQTLEQYNES
jgi:outer membrane protein assembly factor BamD (BamD/ComL family)